MCKGRQAIKELLPFIVSAAEVAAESVGCLPEDILLATINHIQKYKKPPNTQLKLDGLKRLSSPCPCYATKIDQCYDWCRFYPPTT